MDADFLHEHKRIKRETKNEDKNEESDMYFRLCRQCCKSFHSKQHYLAHLEEHEVKGTKKCGNNSDTLTAEIISKDMFESHQVNNDKILNCTKCQFIATIQQSLELHHIVHCTKPPYQCTECNYQTSLAGNFNYHILKHKNDKPHNCQHCISCFSTTGHLQKHMKSQHPNSVIKCNKCDFSTYMLTTMHEHDDQCLLNEDKLKCKKCKFIATKAVSLELHLIVHSTKPPYQCTECEYQTSFAGHFNSHVLKHNKDKPYSCPHCISCFSTHFSLKRHVRSQHLGLDSVIYLSKTSNVILPYILQI